MTYYLPARILFFLRLYWRLYDTLWNSQCLTTWSNRFWLLFCKTQSRWGRNEGKKRPHCSGYSSVAHTHFVSIFSIIQLFYSRQVTRNRNLLTGFSDWILKHNLTSYVGFAVGSMVNWNGGQVLVYGSDFICESIVLDVETAISDWWKEPHKMIV